MDLSGGFRSEYGSIFRFSQIVADRAGWLHVFGFGNAQDVPYAQFIMYRRWDGQSWSEPVDVLISQEGRIDNFVATVDGRRWLHAVWWTGDRGTLYYSRAPVPLATSAANWSKPVAIERAQSGPAALVVGPGDVLHLFYADAEGGDITRYSRSENGGTTWTEPATVVGSDGSPIGWTPGRLIVDESGTFHAIWIEEGERAYYASSRDAVTWGEPFLLAEKDPEGDRFDEFNLATYQTNVYAVWQEKSPPQKFFRYSTDGGHTWSPVLHIFPGLWGAAAGTSLVVDSAGTLHAFAGVHGTKPGAMYWTRWDGNNWSEPVAVPGSEGDPHGPSTALTEGNRLHLVWMAPTEEMWPNYYATYQTNAPYIAPETGPDILPTPTPTIEAKPSPTSPVPTVTPTPPSVSRAQPTGSGPIAANNPWSPIALGVLPAGALIVAVVLGTHLARRRSWRG
jgi:hypothetical protein